MYWTLTHFVKEILKLSKGEPHKVIYCIPYPAIDCKCNVSHILSPSNSSYEDHRQDVVLYTASLHSELTARPTRQYTTYPGSIGKVEQAHISYIRDIPFRMQVGVTNTTLHYLVCYLKVPLVVDVLKRLTLDLVCFSCVLSRGPLQDFDRL